MGRQLAPGTYTFRVFSGVGALAHLWAGGAVSVAGAALFDVPDSPVPVDTGTLALEAGGGIAGRVTNESSVAILGATVNIFDAATGAHVICCFTTDGSGDYDTGSILSPSATYQVLASASGFVPEWYSGHLSQSQADPVTVTAGSSTLFVDFTLGAGGGISGVVSHGGSGIGGVSVSAGAVAPNSIGAGTVTATDGSYLLTGLPGGDYKVQAVPANVPPVSGQFLALQWFNNKPTFDEADTVTVNAPGITAGKNMVLSLGGGSITGTVTSEGNPVPFADVQIFLTNGRFVMSVQASASGFFDTGHVLPAGSYRVRAGPQFGVVGVGTLYYPGAVSSSASTPVSVTANGNTPNIDVDLPVAGGVIGQITCAAVQLPLCPSAGSPVSGAQIYINDFASKDFVTGGFSTNATGHYSTGRVLAPGSYQVQVQATGFGERWAFGKPDGFSADAVAVLSGNDTTVNETLLVAGAISGQVTCAPSSGPGCNASGQLAGARVQADLVNGGNFQQTVTASDGTYTIMNLTPASNYKVQAIAPGFATRFYNGRTSGDPATVDPVPVNAGATTGGVNFNLPAGAGGISGNITGNGSGIPFSGVSIHLATGGFVLFVGADGAGHYNSGATLGAGQYKVEARNVPGFPNLWFNGAATFNAATPVTVSNGTTQTVNLSLPTGGGLTGQVTCVPSSGPGCNALGQLAGATIEILEPVTGDFVTGGITTDAAGIYQTGHALDPSRTYKVRVRAGGFLTRFHNPGGSVATVGAATPVSVVGGADQSGIDVFLPVATGLAGTIRRADTNAPLANAAVQVYDAATDAFVLGPDSSGANGMTTNGSGQYDSGLVLPPGDYKVRAHASGFQDRLYVDAEDLTGATPVTTTAGSVPGINIDLPPNPLPPLTLRDTFEGATLDQTLWSGANLDIVRRITGGKVDLALTTANVNLNNNLRFLNESINPFSNLSIQADVALTAVDLAGMQTRARINFGLFNVNASAPVPNDQTGDVQVEFALQHTGSALRVYISVFRCDDPLCGTGVDLFFTTSAFDPGPLGSEHMMSVTWAAGAKTLTFGFDAQTPVSFTVPGAFPVARAVNLSFSNLSLRIRAATGGAAGKSGSASATLDNVVVNGVPYDDFATGEIDPAKWKDLELVRQVGGGVFTSSLRRVGFSGSNNMNLANANAVTTMQADVTVTADTNVSASPQARLVGAFYNNGDGAPGDSTGDILAGIGISHGGAIPRGFFFVVRCTNNNCNVPGEFVTLVSDNTTFGTVDPGTTHRLSLEWDPVNQIFTFGFDGVTRTVAPTGFPGFAVVNPTPHSAFKAIGTRVDGIGSPPEPGEGGSVTATFDNFVAGHFVSGRVTTGNGVTPLPGATVTAYASGSPVATAASEADGTYTIPDLPAGTYEVGATAAGFMGRFFRGKPTLASADPIVIAPGGAVVGVNLPLTIAGGGTTSSYGLDTPPPLITASTTGQLAGQEMGPIQIAENGVGALTAGGTITLTLPSNVTFNARPVVSTIVGNELQTTPGSFFTGSSSYAFTVSVGSQNNLGRLLVSGLVVDVAAGASIGAVNIDIGGTSGVSPASIHVATAVQGSSTPTIDPGFSAVAGQSASPAVITVTGVNFAPGATVSIGTVVAGVFTPAANIAVIPISGTASSLEIGVTVGSGVPPGSFAVRVDNGGGEATVLPDAFVVQAAPTVTDTDKKGAAALLQNVPRQQVTITGTGFKSSTTAPTQVLFEAASGINPVPDSVEMLSSQSITVYVDVPETTGPGTYAVTVVNPDGGVSPPAAGAFVAVTNVIPIDAPIGAGAPLTKPPPSPPPPPVPPVISNLTPSAARLGAAIVINGSLFGTTPGANAVTFAGFNGTRVVATVNTASAGSLNVTVPAQAVDGPVTVAKSGILSNAAAFTVTNPRLSAVGPATGAQGAVVPLQLIGTKFAPGATVTLSPATGVTLGAATITPTSIQLNATVAAGAPTGFRAMTVTNPDTGASTLTNAFEVRAPAVGAFDLTLAGVSLGTFLPSVQSVALTLDSTGKCTAKTVTPTALTLQAQFVSDLVPKPAPPPSITFSLASSGLPGTAINEDCELGSPPRKTGAWACRTRPPNS